MKIKIVKPKIWNFELVKGKDAWREVTYSARISGVPPTVSDEEVFKMMVRNDYGSSLEHVILKFEIRISKGNAPEFLEHRIASHTGYSTRYIRVDRGIDREELRYEIILPPHLLEDSQRKKDFIASIEGNIRLYEDLLETGFPKETARYILPFCQAVGIYHVTINLRSLLNLLSLRLCVRASPELRCIASQLYFNLTEQLPIIRELIGCRGFMKGVCPESGVTGVRVGKQHSSYPPCSFKNKNTIFIPTQVKLRKGLTIPSFDTQRAVEVQEKLFKKWAAWE